MDYRNQLTAQVQPPGSGQAGRLGTLYVATLFQGVLEGWRPARQLQIFVQRLMVTHFCSTVKTTKFSGVTWLKFELYEIAKTVPAAMVSFWVWTENQGQWIGLEQEIRAHYSVLKYKHPAQPSHPESYQSQDGFDRHHRVLYSGHHKIG